MSIGIYIIRNKINLKVYIGQSIELETRLIQHKSNLKKNYHKNPYLQKAFNKYGEQNFEFEILEEVSKEFLGSFENFWCNMMLSHNRDFGYNIEPTGPNGAFRLAEETKEKISLLRKEQYKDPTKNPFFGKKHSQETKLLMSNKGKGLKKKPWTEERKVRTLTTRAQTVKKRNLCLN